MKKILDFIRQQIFPGIYATIANKKLNDDYETQKDFEVDITAVAGLEKTYIDQIKDDLEKQRDRKIRIEDKAKSLLFIIAVAITAITFSLNYLNLLVINSFQLISISLVFASIIYLVFGAIRSLQTLNIRPFNINQSEIVKNNDRFVLHINQNDNEALKEFIKCKELNDLFINRLSNFTYASFTLIRNGIVLFVLFFISTISFSYFTQKEETSTKDFISKVVNVKINDTIHVKVPYTFEIKYDIGNLKLLRNKK